MDTMWMIALIAAAVGQIALALAVGIGVRRADTRMVGKAQLETRRARKLLEWLCLLTDTMTEDMDEHRTRIDAINEQLESLDQQSQQPITALVIDVVGEMIEVNGRLREKLMSAEIRLQQQRTEIDSQQNQALTDPLTRLPNRRAFDDDLGRLFATWLRRATPFSVLLVDVDHFKQFNDRYGHLAGDKVLRQLAGVLKRSLRAMDMVARIGGEEYAVILPETVGSQAIAAAQKILETVEATRFSYDGSELRATVSVGLATIAGDQQPTELIRRADEALYASKSAGRNCGHIHDRGTCVPFESDQAPAPETAHAALPANLAPSSSGDLLEICNQLRQRVAQLDMPLGMN